MSTENREYFIYDISPILLFGGIIAFSLTSIFSVSGFAQQINYNQVVGWIAVLFLFIYGRRFIKEYLFEKPIVNILFYFVITFETIYILLNFKSSNQILNLITLFGLPFFVCLFASIDWRNLNFFKAGLILNILSCILVWFFLPGHTLSGWNSNSPIFIVPIMLFGLSSIAISDNPHKRMLILLMGALDAYLILQLGNRSALLALCLFFAGYFVPKLYEKKLYFFLILLALIVFNVAAPLFQDMVVNSELYKSAISISSSSVEKGGGLNGREGLWFMALKVIDLHPLFGNCGSRYLGIYFHNFSLDILIQFGWIGWVAFFSMLIFIMMKCFTHGSPVNIFLWGFVCLLPLNTFENAMVCNDYFSIFPYLLISIPFNLNYISYTIKSIVEIS